MQFVARSLAALIEISCDLDGTHVIAYLVQKKVIKSSQTTNDNTISTVTLSTLTAFINSNQNNIKNAQEFNRLFLPPKILLRPQNSNQTVESILQRNAKVPAIYAYERTEDIELYNECK